MYIHIILSFAYVLLVFMGFREVQQQKGLARFCQISAKCWITQNLIYEIAADQRAANECT